MRHDDNTPDTSPRKAVEPRLAARPSRPTLGILQPLIDLVADAVAERLASKGEPIVTFYDARSAPCGRRTFLAAAARGEFPSSKVGRKVLAKKADVDAWIEGRTRKPMAAVQNDDRGDDIDRLLAAHRIRPTKRTA